MRSTIKAVAAAALILATAGAAAEVSKPKPGRNDLAIARAQALIRAQPTVFRLSPADRFVARDVVIEADGTEHVRFDRTFAGLPVIGGDVVVHSNGRRLIRATQTLTRQLKLDNRPSLPAADAIVAAGTEFGAGFTGTPVATLVIFARDPRAPRLAWRVQLQDDTRDMTYFVDAHAGALLDRWSNNETAAAAGTAHLLYTGNVPLTTNSVTAGYELRDPTRGGLNTLDASNSRTSGRVYADADNTWGNYTVTDAATIAAEAQYGAATTWDYFLSAHGRSGIAGDGVGSRSRVHYGIRYNNAFWNNACFCMTYGDGDGVITGPLVSLDVSGHEMAHGVTAHTAGLVYSGESGGLNEANSDIFGTMVEFYANNSLDTGDYLMGEETVIANVSGAPDQRALRYMYNPSRDTRSPNCWSASLATLDVHYSSGVGNRFFYLLAEGSGARTYSGVDHATPTCNGGAVSGVGREKAGRIWYRALTLYFTSTTNYAGARAATLLAATDLYGAGSAEANAVAAAWSAVSVN
jgi:Zn-dependent metalloprotease